MRIAINGIGIAGSTLAYWLRVYGHEPVLYERAPALRTGGYLIDFWGVGYNIAERMGLLPTLRQQGYLIRRMRLVAGDGHEVGSLDLDSMRETLDGRLISLSRDDLARAIMSACAGLPCHFGTYVTGIQQTDRAVLATLSDGRKERFDLVIGAGGLHSGIRELVFGPQARFEIPLGCYVAAFRVPGYPHRDELTYVSHTVPKRQVARVALREGQTLFLLICRAELMPGEAPRNHPGAALHHVFGDMDWEVPAILRAMDQAEDLYFDRVSQIQLPHWSSGRVALIGDAAACPSLLAGEGAGLAMLEAYVLAGELHRAGGEHASAFAAYENRLHPLVRTKQRLALGFRSFFAPRTTLGLKTRDFAVRLLGSPVLGKRLFARALRDEFILPDYQVA